MSSEDKGKKKSEEKTPPGQIQNFQQCPPCVPPVSDIFYRQAFVESLEPRTPTEHPSLPVQKVSNTIPRNLQSIFSHPMPKPANAANLEPFCDSPVD
jgi:hypothetical protein